MEPWQDSRTGQPKHLGEIWTLAKGAHKAVCELVGHPLGSEARLFLDGRLIRQEHFSTGKEMLDVTDAWRKMMEADGWRAAISHA